MKYRLKLICSLACLLGLGSGQPLAGSASARPGYILTPAQIRQLRTLKIRMMLPTYVPAGFRINTVSAEIINTGGPGDGPSYLIDYRGPWGMSFMVEALSSGLGGPSYDTIHKLRHPRWGLIDIYFNHIPGLGPSYTTDWMGEEAADKAPRYHVFSPSDEHPGNRAVTKAEFHKIVRSLTYISF